MTNPYYTDSGAPTTLSRGISSLIRAQFAALQAAFDKLATFSGNAGKLVAVKSTADGLEAVSTVTAPTTFSAITLTGTPIAPTAATGTSTTQIATTEFVANTAFSSALPAQAGKQSGSVLVTDGTNASWSSPPVGSALYLAQFSSI